MNRLPVIKSHMIKSLWFSPMLLMIPMMCTHKYMHIEKNFFLDYTVLHIPGVAIIYGLTIFKAFGRVNRKIKTLYD